ncbi:MAG: Fe-Mn family superoxide dismutase [Pseudomonadota bacterium]|nr:Fe-Mn family superoxide dismutase [Pseudomonadota bacterium]
MHTLPPLPYEKDALEPLISAETLDYHYGKHHKTYVDKLNVLIENTPFKDKDLIEIIKNSEGPIFNNAAQIWNHTFYWHCLTPEKNTKPSKELMASIIASFGSFESFQKQFKEHAMNNFGSGWTWLVADKNKQLSIVDTSNAHSPISGETYHPLMTCDVWEHAYYIDARNNRAQYLENYMELVNWTFVNEQFNSQK